MPNLPFRNPDDVGMDYTLDHIRSTEQAFGTIDPTFRSVLADTLRKQYSQKHTIIGVHGMKFKNRRFISTVAVLGCIVCLLSISVFAFPESTFSQGIVHTFQELFISNEEPISPEVSTTVEMTFTSSDLDSAQKQLPFPILQPARIPSGFKLKSVQLSQSEVEGPGVTLLYGNGYSIMRFSQSKPSTPVRITISPDRIDQTMDINGHTAVFYPVGDDELLQWTNGEYWFELRGKVSSEILIEVARSIN